MTPSSERTVWFSVDWLLATILFLPVWLIAGLGWGLFMKLAMEGSLLGWLIAGLLWGAFVWFFFGLFLLIAYRQVATTLPLPQTAMFSECLEKAVKPLWYQVEQSSATTFLCKPKFGLLRFLDLSKLHVKLHDGGAELLGPAIAVNKVRKQLNRSLPSASNRSP